MTDEAVERRAADVAAKEVVSKISRAVLGKQGDENLQTSADTLLSLGRLLTALTNDLESLRTRNAVLETSMLRIAALQVRGGRELIEQGKWKMVSEELQSIAQEATRR